RLSSEHPVGEAGQPPEEVDGRRRHGVPEHRVAEVVEPAGDGHHLGRHGVQRDGDGEADADEDPAGARVPPAHQRLHPLPLRRDVAHDALHPPRQRPQPLVARPEHLRRRHGVELLLQVVGLHRVGLRQPRVHAGGAARPEPVVPDADEEDVERRRGHGQLRVPDEDEVEDVNEHGGGRAAPPLHAVEPPREPDGPGEHPHDAEPVRLGAPHAPRVRVHVEHVAHHLPPQRRLGPLQPRGDDAHGGGAQRLLLRDADRAEVVHPRQQRRGVGGPGVRQVRRRREPHGELHLPHLLEPRPEQHEQRVRRRVRPVALQRGHAHPHLPDPVVLPLLVPGAGEGEHPPVVEHRHREHRARVVHLPRVLLVPPRVEAVRDGARPHPLLAVLGHAVGVRRPLGAALRLHRQQPARPDDAQLQHAHRRPPQLLRRRPVVAAHVRRLVEHVVPSFQAQTEVKPAGVEPRRAAAGTNADVGGATL
ncbi:hypothetical protein EE612_003765, partial [Oryza sativa]